MRSRTPHGGVDGGGAKPRDSCHLTYSKRPVWHIGYTGMSPALTNFLLLAMFLLALPAVRHQSKIGSDTIHEAKHKHLRIDIEPEMRC
jgi:hypothetical protein